MSQKRLVKSIDEYGRTYEIYGIEFEIEKWDFNNDGMFGHIYFTVPKGSYKYDSNNGAYCYKKDSKYDGIHVATPCFLDEEDAMEIPLSKILKEAIAFADLNLQRN